MDTPLAAAIHKENVHGEKTTVTMKPDKLKTAKTAGKKRKASADLRGIYIPVAGASKDVDLKQKSAMKGNEIKKNQMTQGKQHAAAADRTTKKHLTDEEIKQCCEWPNHILLTDEEIKQYCERPNHILTDEEIKLCREWVKYGTEEGIEDDWDQIHKLKSTLPETMASLLGVPISELEQPFLSDEEGYKTDGSDFDHSKLVPGPDSLVYTPKELDDAFDKARMVLKEYPFPELKLDDD